jgi:hypothetical protein
VYLRHGWALDGINQYLNIQDEANSVASRVAPDSQAVPVYPELTMQRIACFRKTQLAENAARENRGWGND